MLARLARTSPKNILATASRVPTRTAYLRTFATAARRSTDTMSLYRPFGASSLLGDLFNNPFLREPNVLDDFGNRTLTRGLAATGLRADVHEQRDKYVVEAEVPGVAKENVKIEIDQQEATPRLRISASFRQTYESPQDQPQGAAQGAEAGKKEKAVAPHAGTDVTKSDATRSRVLLSERSYGSFSRTYTLPENADYEKIRATQKDGLLSIVIPKRTPEERQPRQISIEHQ